MHQYYYLIIYLIFFQLASPLSAAMVEQKGNPLINMPRDEDGNTWLHIAAAKGHFDEIRTQLSSNLNGNASILINSKNSTDQTALHLAAKYNYPPVIWLLIKYGAEINLPDVDGRTPFLIACKNRALESIQMLAKQGAEMQLFDRFGKGALDLFYATKSNTSPYTPENSINDLDAVIDNENQIEPDFFVNNKNFDLNKIILLTGSPKAVEKKLKTCKGALYVKDILGNTPLHNAVKDGLIKTVDVLVKAGADVNAQNDYDSTPLHLAYQGEQWAIIRTLMQQKNINPSIRDGRGNFAINYAPDYAKKEEELFSSIAMDEKITISTHSSPNNSPYSMSSQEKPSNATDTIQNIPTIPSAHPWWCCC